MPSKALKLMKLPACWGTAHQKDGTNVQSRKERFCLFSSHSTVHTFTHPHTVLDADRQRTLGCSLHMYSTVGWIEPIRSMLTVICCMNGSGWEWLEEAGQGLWVQLGGIEHQSIRQGQRKQEHVSLVECSTRSIRCSVCRCGLDSLVGHDPCGKFLLSFFKAGPCCSVQAMYLHTQTGYKHTICQSVEAYSLICV